MHSRSRPPRIALLLLTLASLAGPAAADALRARVIAVTGGDTATALDAGGRQLRIRLVGVAAPDAAQAFGPTAKTRLAALIYDREVNILESRQDGRGRIVGKLVVLQNAQCQGPACPGLDAGLEQIKAGMAWWYRRQAQEQTTEDRAAYEQAEFQAKIHRAGLWNDCNPVPPWQVRRDDD